ncbi:MAG: biopolymer transporter ExbD [Flavisolibacter sp.]|nr:biopolymer transporter ExbD [Flavisolibacter sp.]MBD0297039.1 biopolymer transporter ExbD [Flavisolibacter sp.]MBD0350595.1 biopolymer transporter ExbD [Flavisolibacter sp.]MBD0365887.1 biopolymer transporter ExbD [Flavisolibacter sp.]MBD0374540.1 biopolymer transporter ExbD [Flavisolibacter sp.]
MADIDVSGGDSGHKKGPGVKKAKKLSTRVDMTPMVDLGFLLITFFIFTATMSSPAAMKLFMPKDTDKNEEQNKAKESGALTIMMSKDNHVYYYEGQLAPDASNFQTSSYDPSNGIRQVIMKKKRTTPIEDLVVVIKPDEEATYKNTVDMLDEMTINEIKRFALVDISPVERELISKTEGGPAPATTTGGTTQ